MGRRLLHAALLSAGFAPAVWAICILTNDPRRAAVLLTLAALGITLNAIALAKPDFGLRVPLRVIAGGVALIVLGFYMAMWQWIHGRLLPATPPAATDRREMLQMQSDNLLWIVVAVGYVFLTILILPVPPRKPDSQAGPPKRIDFRRFGR